jgi:diketogulonate reductase-like aldo/keto reductase
MVELDNLRYTKMALNNGSGAIPALGFGTLIPDPVATKNATKAAPEAGFRQLDAAERYGNEKEVGEAMQEVLDYVDLYVIHTPFAFQPGDEQDPSPPFLKTPCGRLLTRHNTS